MAATYHEIHPDFAGARRKLETRLFDQAMKDQWGGRSIEWRGRQTPLLSMSIDTIRRWAYEEAIRHAEFGINRFEHDERDDAMRARGEAV